MSTRVLIVEDDAALSRLLLDNFRFEGFTVDSASDGADALEKAETFQPDLVLLDLMLPGLSGFDVCRTLSARESRPGIIIITSRRHKADKVRGLELGADDYVTKPFGPRELVARLSAALRRAGTSADEPVIEADGLAIDLAARVVKRDGEEVHLTPIEYDLLRTLARNRGRLMTTRALLVEVWGPEYEFDTQVLRTHVARLRAKIEPEGGPRFIRTDPGVGYRFVG